MIRIAVALCVATSSFALAQDRPSVRLEPGLWKVQIKSSQGGKPLPDKTENRCYSAAEVDDPVTTFGTLFTNQTCTRTHTISGQTLTFGATCTGPAPQGGTLAVRAEGSYVFEDTKRFTSSLVTTFTLPNQPGTVVSLSKDAEFVGPCPN
ncbi:MAG TPA: DUF3617 family protein [Xanthobacteraceae bacterium]